MRVTIRRRDSPSAYGGLEAAASDNDTLDDIIPAAPVSMLTGSAPSFAHPAGSVPALQFHIGSV